MQSFPQTVVLRHSKENLKKCSLRGLESRTDFKFFTYPKDVLTNLNGYIMLAVDAPPLTKQDCQKGLFILDSTWAYADKMMRFVEKPRTVMEKRSIPNHYRTAYPRRQDDCPDPERGLASIEAIYIAYTLLERNCAGLMDNYYWKDKFFEINNIK